MNKEEDRHGERQSVYILLFYYNFSPQGKWITAMIIIDSDQLPLKDWFEIHDRRVEIAAEKYLWWVSQSSKQEELCVFKTARKKTV